MPLGRPVVGFDVTEAPPPDSSVVQLRGTLMGIAGGQAGRMQTFTCRRDTLGRLISGPTCGSRNSGPPFGVVAHAAPPSPQRYAHVGRVSHGNTGHRQAGQLPNAFGGGGPSGNTPG